jgi:hypothetical protein
MGSIAAATYRLLWMRQAATAKCFNFFKPGNDPAA